MKIIKYPARGLWIDLIERPEVKSVQMSTLVKDIMSAVHSKGDRAVYAYTERFDKVKLKHIKVPFTVVREIASGVKKEQPELYGAICAAKLNIEAFHRAQLSGARKVETCPGVTCWQKPVPIERIGIYVPGGSAPLLSTVLMLGIPAKLAGCKDVILCTPPNKFGDVDSGIIAAAKEAGVDGVYKVGGIQAIAAMAYGTETVPRVHKIFGPGNQYVTAAKKWVATNTDVAIDMPAGPSEVMIMADDSANPIFVAADMLSQAEHGPDSQAVLLTVSEEIADKVKNEVYKQLGTLPRRDIAEKSIENSVIVVLEKSSDMVELANIYAPEHLLIQTMSPMAVAENIVNAGSVFIGHYAPESAGDYASGTNHTLPTSGYARMYSGVNIDSFMKKITFQEISQAGLMHLAPVIETLATAESLEAHRRAVTLRLK